MNYECIESKRDHGWAVEAINHEGDGEISRALFMGHEAEARAREYAQWKTASCNAALPVDAPKREPE